MKSLVQNVSVIFLVLQSALFGSPQPIEDCANQKLEVQRIQGENTALQAQLTSLQAESTESAVQCSTIQAEAQSQLFQLQSEKEGFLVQVATLQGNNIAFRQQLVNLHADNTKLQEHLDTLQATNAGQHSQINTLKEQMGALQGQIAELTGQHNWVASTNGQSCDHACAAVGGQCNERFLRNVDSADKIRAVYQYISGKECATAYTSNVGDEPGFYTSFGIGTECVLPERHQDVKCSANLGAWGLARMCCCGYYCPTTI